jgi:two-component system sensor histidine kinase BaeS
MSRIGLRARLAVALVAVAALAVGFATFFSYRGLHPRLEETAQARLQRSAAHFAEVTAAAHRQAGSLESALPELRHLAQLDELRAEVRTPRGTVSLTGPLTDVRASAPVVVAGRAVGTVAVSPASGTKFTPEEEHLRESLNRLHLIAGGAAIVAALGIAFLLAETLTRPLRRLRQGAEQMERGDLDARIDPGGAPELAAVGRALNRLSETLEHEEEIRKANAADLAHELRTPVNALLSRIEAAQDGVLREPDNLAAMHAEALRLTRLLDDLARLADAERPGLLLDKRPVDVAAVARRVAESFAPRFEDTGVALVVDAAPVEVLADEDRLEQIGSNLVANAWRYTDSGEVRIRVAREGDEAVLEVSDTGAGIAPDDLRHVFSRFWRGDRSRSRATGGAGIGLAIVRELVRAHEGRIDVDSRPGHGSTFRVVLSAAEQPQQARRTASSTP